MASSQFGDVSVTIENYVAVVEIHRPPHNYFDLALIRSLKEAFQALDADANCRSLVLASDGKSFCAGTNFQTAVEEPVVGPSRAERLYSEALNLFANQKPIVVAVQGTAVGGGLGLALVGDFRVASPETRFVANFVKLGIHPGFGLTYTLPKIIGVQKANLMFYTGYSVSGEEAFSWGLADFLVPADELRLAAIKFAERFTESAPLAVSSTRATMREGLIEAVKKHLVRELAEQFRLRQTQDHQEGLKAARERRTAIFEGR
jgi:enoyl-CoA hydratase/carnithine racemase